MILLWGAPGDPPLDGIRDRLASRGASVGFADQRYGPVQDLQLVARDGRVTGTLARPAGPASRTLELDVVRAAYIRPVATERACAFDGPDDPARAHVSSIELGLLTWADCGPASVINRPSAMAANNAKPYQLAMIARAGFDVPDTLVTTVAADVRAFWQRHGRVIYKSISGVRSIVRKLDDADIARLANVASCPTQFQEYIAGTDVRVHVVGDDVFATAIESIADDYRYASRVDADVRLDPIEIPPHVAERCRRMVHDMGLLLAGIDLRRTPDDRWVCFEVNPSPAFPYYDQHADEPAIEAAIVELLIRLDD